MLRDVFRVAEYKLLLKLEEAGNQNESNAREVSLAAGTLGCWCPCVYGCCVCRCQGAKMSALVMQSVRWDFCQFMGELRTFTASERRDQALIVLTGSFVCLMRDFTSDKNFCFAERHWGNVGVTSNYALRILDLEPLR